MADRKWKASCGRLQQPVPPRLVSALCGADEEEADKEGASEEEAEAGEEEARAGVAPSGMDMGVAGNQDWEKGESRPDSVGSGTTVVGSRESEWLDGAGGWKVGKGRGGAETALRPEAEMGPRRLRGRRRLRQNEAEVASPEEAEMERAPGLEEAETERGGGRDGAETTLELEEAETERGGGQDGAEMTPGLEEAETEQGGGRHGAEATSERSPEAAGRWALAGTVGRGRIGDGTGVLGTWLCFGCRELYLVGEDLGVHEMEPGGP